MITEQKKSKIEHQDQLEEVFSAMIETGKKLLKEDNFHQTVFLISRDNNSGKLSAGLVPIVNTNPGDTAKIARMLKIVISGLKDNPSFNLIGVVTCMDAFMSVHDRKDALTSTGEFRKDTIKPSEDPNAKDVLIFTLETRLQKHSVIYEYIRTGNDVVIQEKPMIDSHDTYDEIVAKSHFGFLFTEPMTSQN